MKKHLSKFFGILAAVVCLASPLSLMAGSGHGHGPIQIKDVVGTYQINGFSNSFTTPPLGVQSQAAVGQITLNSDGTANIPFADFTVVTIAGTVVSTHFEDVSAIFTVGPINGEGTITLLNFPTQGANPVFRVAFKKHCHKVTGFSAVIATNTTSNLWTLLQAERFN